MISIITPVLNEEGYVEPLLSHLDDLEGNFELIIVDGGSTDGTLMEIEASHNGFGRDLVVIEAEQGRGLQMNRGAEEARGDILLFLHADSMIPDDALLSIERAFNEEKVVGGGFKQAFCDPDLFLRLGSTFGNLRAGVTKTFYGDSGIFLRRDVFEMIGGYDPIPFLEDIEICKKARRYGKLIQLDRYIHTSPRRFFSKGKIRLTVVFIIAVMFNSIGIRPGFLTRYIVDK